MSGDRKRIYIDLDTYSGLCATAARHQIKVGDLIDKMLAAGLENIRKLEREKYGNPRETESCAD